MVRMVAVDWESVPPRIVKVAEEPLRADTGSDGKIRFHAVTWDRICVDGEFLDAQVGVEDAADVRYARDLRALHRIESADGRSLWVEEKHAFASFRTAGTLHLLVDGVDCEIEIRPSELSTSEFDELLTDFSGTLWEILMAPESAVLISGVRDLGDSCAELIRRLERFVRAVRSVLAAPKKTLESITVVDRPSRIRPIPATYLDRLRRPDARRLVGRSHRESLDTAENRYLLHLCSSAEHVAAHCELAATRRCRELEHVVSEAGRQIREMDGTEVISLGDLRDRIQREKHHVARWASRKQRWLVRQAEASFSGALAGCVETELTFYVKSIRDSVWSSEGFNVQLIDSMWHDRIVEPGQTYIARGFFREYQQHSPPVYLVVMLRDLELSIPQPLRTYSGYEEKAQREGLDTVRVSLRPGSQKEQDAEKEALRLRSEAMESAARQWAGCANELARLRGELRSATARVRHELGVRSCSKAPSSVVCLQNPRYSRALAAYRAIVAHQAVPMEKLLQANKWGVLDIPAVYERWCLIRVIHALLLLGYCPAEQAWKSTLVEALGSNTYQFARAAVRLRNPKAARDIEVHYQGFLKGKRPDLMLVVTSSADTSGRNWLVILDSKFKPLTSRLGPPAAPPAPMTIQKELRLTLDKYDGDNHFVFIVHPSEKAFPGPKAGPVRFTSQLGGIEVLHADDRPNHRYGAIFAKPGLVDGLYAAIGMALQYSMEENSTAYNERQPEHPRFCVICGSTRLAKITARVDTKGTWWECVEPECKHRMIQHYCLGCGNRIWKHGARWTYHETMLGDSYNIRCPECGALY